MTAERYRAYGKDGNVVHEGNCAPDGSAKFTTAEDVVARIVFYSGSVEEESVAGVVEPINAAGKISAQILD